MTHGRRQVSRRGVLAASAAIGGGVLLPAGQAVAQPGDLVTVTPGDARYPDLVRGWNQRYVGRPDAVHVPRSTAQVAAAVRQAVRSGKRFTVRSGGHCWEDFVFSPDVRAVIDMSAMRDVDFDASMNAFMVQPGAQLLDVYERLYRTWGVTVPAGMCFQVGAGGHVSGGGWGLLCRRLGLVVDHLYAVEVVVVNADGTVRTVVATREDNDPNRDLWWAHTGGGGGNFGVVTRYWFRSPGASGTDPARLLPAPPPEVLVSAVSWKWSDLDERSFTRLVRNYADWHVRHAAPDDPATAVCSLLSLNHVSNGAVGLITHVDASVPGAARLHDEFLAAVGEGVTAAHGPVTTRMGELAAMPDLVVPRRLPWLQAARYLGTANPTTNDPTQKSDFKSAYMKAGFPQRQLAALYRHLTRTDIGNPTGSVMLSSFAGQVSAVAQDATASAHRDAAYKLAWMIWWDDPDDEKDCVRWLREFYADMYADTGGVPVPGAVTDGCYVNYPDADLGSAEFNRSGTPWHDLYYKGNYRRLQRIKQAYDPGNVFRHRQSVRLPGS